uniref:Regulator of G protein signaling 2 n=1 Tax=Molossus molossus TaxID=27622 RepID=A0A7J8BNH0_MOLMO|nr:regulator of G protein signaling 2 [Molossus molossus]
MQSAMFLAVHHDCGAMDKSAGCGPKGEEKREKMKRTLLKDWKTRLSYFLQHSSSPEKPKTGKKSKQQAFIRPSPEEAQLWSEAFDELLASKCKLTS